MQPILTQAAQCPQRVAALRAPRLYIAVRVPLRIARQIEAMDPQLRADILRKIYRNTIDTGEPGVTAWRSLNGDYSMNDEDAPKSGFMVGIPGADGENPNVPTLPSAQSLDKFFDDRADDLAKAPYGGWEFPRAHNQEEQQEAGVPRWYHDVSQHFESPHDALAAAQKGNQLAVWELGKGELSTSELQDRVNAGHYD